MTKDNLLIICCGKDSLHQKWEVDHLEHSFDLCLIDYEGADYQDNNSKNAKYFFSNKGTKFENIAKFISKEIYRKYERIGIIDDDINATPHQLDALFAIGKIENFDLWQPAYTRHGHPSHVDFLAQDPNYDYRIFNTVEIMCPFFSQRAYNVVCNEFDTSPYSMGYGLEYAFEKILSSQKGTTIFGGKVAVVDCIPVTHTRPITPRYEISEADIWYYRHKFMVDYLRVFDRSIIQGVRNV